MASEKSICPNCQADTYGVDQCWLCRADLSKGAANPFSIDQPPLSPASGSIGSFPHSENLVPETLSSESTASNPYAPPVPIANAGNTSPFAIVLGIGLALVFAALLLVAPGLAILLGIIAAPALIRTAVVISKRSAQGEVISTGDRSLLFMASMGGVLLACMAAIGTFFIACAATCFGMLTLEATQTMRGVTGEMMFTLALGFCGLLSFLVGILVLRRTWSTKQRKGKRE